MHAQGSSPARLLSCNPLTSFTESNILESSGVQFEASSPAKNNTSANYKS